MPAIDLCKLRPGDVIFTSEPTSTSLFICGITGGRFSHAIIVLYPDVWFQTDGAGAGFLLIHDVHPVTTPTEQLKILAQVPGWQFSVLRPNASPLPQAILKAIGFPK
jgi:thiamine pyrophosphokinase